jgi:hypothetical protein
MNEYLAYAVIWPHKEWLSHVQIIILKLWISKPPLGMEFKSLLEILLLGVDR